MEMIMDKDGWPEELIIPHEEEFYYGDWVVLGKDAERVFSESIKNNNFSESMLLAIKEPQESHCGTKCCLVGWMGVAFNGAWSPGGVHSMPLSAAHRSFLTKFLENCDADTSWCGDDGDLLEAASNAFEASSPAMTASMARKLWKKTARDCGYDTKGL